MDEIPGDASYYDSDIPDPVAPKVDLPLPEWNPQTPDIRGLSDPVAPKVDLPLPVWNPQTPDIRGLLHHATTNPGFDINDYRDAPAPKTAPINLPAPPGRIGQVARTAPTIYDSVAELRRRGIIR